MNGQLSKPRWPGGPDHCDAANLPAFLTPKDAAVFRDANSPGTTVIAEWVCTACGWIHFWSEAASPAGASSGTTRTAKHIDSIRERFLKSPAAQTMPKQTRTPHGGE